MTTEPTIESLSRDIDFLARAHHVANQRITSLEKQNLELVTFTFALQSALTKMARAEGLVALQSALPAPKSLAPPEARSIVERREKLRQREREIREFKG